jgi:site-specific DNA-methyltransferase (adenine-specific)
VILQGDCLNVLQRLGAESIDACVTDPPYGIGFMGKEWDTFKPDPEKFAEMSAGRNRRAQETYGSNRGVVQHGRKPIVSDNPNIHGRHRSPAVSPSQIEYDYSVKGLREFQAWCELWAREVFRVLKPGAHIVVCGAPRAYHRMASGLEDAGFEIRDCLAWLFGSGFPKSLNLGEGLGTALKPAHEPIVLARKPFKGSVKANVAQHGTGALNIDACRIEGATDPNKWGGRQLSDIGYQGNGREGYQTQQSDLGRWPPNVACDDVAALVIDEQSGYLQAGASPPKQGLGSSRVYGEADRTGVDKERDQLDGGGASRFFLVARRSKVDSHDLSTQNEPCEKTPGATSGNQTVAGIESGENQEAERSTNSLNIDGSGSEPSDLSRPDTKSTTRTTTNPTTPSITSSSSPSNGTTTTTNDCGRTTASSMASSIGAASDAVNIDPSPSSQIDLLEPSRAIASDAPAPRLSNGETRTANITTPTCASIDADINSGPRFFYCAKPSREERDMGCFGLQARSGGEATDRVEGSAGLNNPRAGAGRTGGGRNFHPTVKPIELMRWLIRLVTPINGVVLDPFLGSGTTGIAAAYEQRQFIGIEREAEYLAIAERRIAAAVPLFQNEQPA